MAIKKGDDIAINMPDRDYELEGLNTEARKGSPFSTSLSGPPSQEQAHLPVAPLSQIANNPAASILGYCLASISMTVVNKYVVSGSDWNLMFLYLAIQVSSPSVALEQRPA